MELDALPASILRELVRRVIEKHIDPFEWEKQKRIERQEREVLDDLSNNLVLVQIVLKIRGKHVVYRFNYRKVSKTSGECTPGTILGI